jgi:hypothetical protein
VAVARRDGREEREREVMGAKAMNRVRKISQRPRYGHVEEGTVIWKRIEKKSRRIRTSKRPTSYLKHIVGECATHIRGEIRRLIGEGPCQT